MKIVLISDTHTFTPYVPNGDILIHAGDFTSTGKEGEIRKFRKWMQSLPHKNKVIIAGNHDLMFENNPNKALSLLGNEVIYLKDSFIIIDGIKIYGAPWTPFFCNWAFNILINTGELEKKWSLIPNDTDILITHGPSYGILDTTLRQESVGCSALKQAIDRVKPMLHVCGHIHEQYGIEKHNNIYFANVSLCTVNYNPTNAPIIVTIENRKIVSIS